MSTPVIEKPGGAWFADGGMRAIKLLAAADRAFDVDDVKELVGEAPSPETWGSLFAAAQRAQLIEPIGSRVAADGRLLRTWHGTPHAFLKPAPQR